MEFQSATLFFKIKVKGKKKNKQKKTTIPARNSISMTKQRISLTYPAKLQERKECRKRIRIPQLHVEMGSFTDISRKKK